MQYPNKKRPTALRTSLNKQTPKHYTAHRGMNLEEDISLSNTYYLDTDRAVIYKKPIPVQIVKVDYPHRSSAKIVEAYYRTPSTTDYNGLYRGRYVDFEAKETKTLNFPFNNIHPHQVKHLERIQKHHGIAFLIIAFTSINEVYLIDAKYVIDRYYVDGPRHLTYDEIKTHGHLIRQSYRPRLCYLDIIDEVYFKEESL